MIDMYHIIAHFELVQLLKCECNFSRTGNIAAQCKFMKTIEYLVVSETANLQIVIDKTFVQCLQNRRKRNDATTIIKNTRNPINLFFTIARNIQRIVVGEVFSKLFGN